MTKRILVPTDGSPASTAAVDAAMAFAHDSGAQIVGLHVVPLRPLLSEGMGVVAAPESEDQARACLADVERRAAQAGVAAQLLTRRADAPSEAILELARDLDCGLIVMALRSKRTGRGSLPGSQTAAVLAHSAVPVMVVPCHAT
ncbi:universal stress protein [Massilia sp. GCM10023247]|uniref:universal stress protein n=1 Tax=Massilia sp. GCM10023247 TaxID=3252643 RepID=UPI0036140678